MSALLLLGSLLIGCNQDEPAPYAELVEAGVDRYLGQAVVREQTRDDGVDNYVFEPSSGPRCLRDTPFAVSVREQPASDELYLFLQGGGACWSDFCLAVERVSPGVPNGLEALEEDLSYNPFSGRNLVYVPYCDGSLFGGDAEFDDNGDGQPDRFQYGLRNLSAALDVAHERFPKPSRIVLAGSSGGGYGTILASVLIRIVWPRVPIDVVADSGTGVARGTTDTAFVRDLVREWNAERFLPESCGDCLKGGHLTPYVRWQLDKDPNLRVAAFSSYHDSVIAGIFLATDVDLFQADLIEQTGLVGRAHPDRYGAFLIRGEAHTTLLGDVRGFLGDDIVLPDSVNDLVVLGSMRTSKVDGVDFATWARWFLDGDERWESRAE